jgi:hypothetical protein
MRITALRVKDITPGSVTTTPSPISQHWLELLLMILHVEQGMISAVWRICQNQGSRRFRIEDSAGFSAPDSGRGIALVIYAYPA